MEKLKLQYPLKGTGPYISQRFGTNNVFIDNKGKSYYQNMGMLGHNGIDFLAHDGTPVYASHEGTCLLEVDSSGGNGVVIFSEKEYEIDGKPKYIKTIYWHLKEDNVCVQSGDKVVTGQLIGLADNTGLSTGSHLHFGLKPCLKSTTHSWIWDTEDINNGYRGSIDPLPYLGTNYIYEKYTFNTTLREGNWNGQVVKLQAVLLRLGFYTGRIDGAFGPLTKKALIDFQIKHQLRPDGIAGHFTNIVLNLK